VILLREGFRPIWQTREAHQYSDAAQRKGFRQTAYTLVLNGADTAEMARHLGAYHQPIRFPRKSKCITDDGWIGYPIAEITHEEYAGSVYDIQVDEAESFQLPGLFGVHNCSIAESCTIIPQLSDWALAEIDVLRPEDCGELRPDGESGTPITEYIDRFDDAQNAIKVLERYAESVKKLIRTAPQEKRTELGFKLGNRRNSVIDGPARKALYETLGEDQFFKMARVTKQQLESIADEDLRGWALGLVQTVDGTTPVVQRLRR